MNVFKNIQKGKNIVFPIVYRGGHYRVTMAWTDLTPRQWSIQGDWGPCYSLSSEVLVNCTYFDVRKKSVESYFLDVKNFCIESPFSSIVRRESPALVRLNDIYKDLKYSLYFSPHANLSEVQYGPLNLYQSTQMEKETL